MRVVFIGGSITEGACASEPSKSYVNMTGEWLKRRYGKNNVQYYNKGVGGTTSYYGLLRFQRDVLAYVPDLLFIEFAVNDSNVNSIAEVEGMIRTLNIQSHKPNVIFLYTTNAEYTTPTENFEKIANYYGIPQINLKDALKEKLNGKNAVEEGYFSDFVHPNDKGHRIYYEEIIACLQKKDFFRKPLSKREKICDVCFGVKTVFLSSSDVYRSVGWQDGINHGKEYSVAECEGEIMEFEFDGDILAIEHGLHQERGMYHVYVDNVFAGTGNPYYNCTSNQLVLGFDAKGLKKGHHKVRIETAKGKNGSSKIILYHIIIGNRITSI